MKKNKSAPIIDLPIIVEKSHIPAEYFYGNFGEERSFKQNPITSRFAGELFDETRSLVVEKTIEVKRLTVGAKGERWKIFENSKLIFVLEGQKLLKKEKYFLRSLDGLRFLISQGKSGIKSFNQIKKALKEVKLNGKSI